MKEFIKNESGTVIVLVAFSMSIFIAFLAVVLDFGSLYLEKNRLQKIADASALAGAQELPSNYLRAREQTMKAISLNGGNPDDFRIDTNSTYTMLEVTTNKKGTLFFANTLGITEPIIEVKARVELHTLESGKGVIPLGVQPSTNLAFGSVQVLKVSDSANGNFGAVALTGSGAREYETDLSYGYAFELRVGSLLNTQTGQLAGPTKRAIDQRLTQCPNATYLNYPPGCSRVVLIPIYEPVSIDQNQVKQVRIVGFGAFFLENVSSTNEGAEVTGRFIKATYSGDSSADKQNFGTFSFKMTQ